MKSFPVPMFYNKETEAEKDSRLGNYKIHSQDSKPGLPDPKVMCSPLSSPTQPGPEHRKLFFKKWAKDSMIRPLN